MEGSGGVPLVRKLDDRVSVAPQIAPGDVHALATLGFTTIINNRPDGESADQPGGDIVAAEAEAAGLAYHAIPVSPAGIAPDQVAAMAAVLRDSPGPVLAYCRSGTRSTNLWALASATLGENPQRLVTAAADAGYDIAGLAPVLRRMAEGA